MEREGYIPRKCSICHPKRDQKLKLQNLLLREALKAQHPRSHMWPWLLNSLRESLMWSWDCFQKRISLKGTPRNASSSQLSPLWLCEVKHTEVVQKISKLINFLCQLCLLKLLNLFSCISLLLFWLSQSSQIKNTILLINPIMLNQIREKNNLRPFTLLCFDCIQVYIFSISPFHFSQAYREEKSYFHWAVVSAAPILLRLQNKNTVTVIRIAISILH